MESNYLILNLRFDNLGWVFVASAPLFIHKCCIVYNNQEFHFGKYKGLTLSQVFTGTEETDKNSL